MPAAEGLRHFRSLGGLDPFRSRTRRDRSAWPDVCFPVDRQVLQTWQLRSAGSVQGDLRFEVVPDVHDRNEQCPEVVDDVAVEDGEISLCLTVEAQTCFEGDAGHLGHEVAN